MCLIFSDNGMTYDVFWAQLKFWYIAAYVLHIENVYLDNKVILQNSCIDV